MSKSSRAESGIDYHLHSSVYHKKKLFCDLNDEVGSNNGNSTVIGRKGCCWYKEW